jgi:hypothetical protein
MLSYLNKNSYWCIFEGAERGSEAIISKQNNKLVDAISVKVCPEKLTHLWM